MMTSELTVPLRLSATPRRDSSSLVARKPRREPPQDGRETPAPPPEIDRVERGAPRAREGSGIRDRRPQARPPYAAATDRPPDRPPSHPSPIREPKGARAR